MALLTLVIRWEAVFEIVIRDSCYLRFSIPLSSFLCDGVGVFLSIFSAIGDTTAECTFNNFQFHLIELYELGKHTRIPRTISVASVPQLNGTGLHAM